ncbi:MAG: hypothetical protein WB643_00220 [Candidatus Bathyarchaeia archaeon]
MSNKEKQVSENTEVTRRLDAIIALLAKTGDRKLGESIVILRNAGLRPIDISRILGKSLSHVTKELAVAKKRKGGE